MPRACDITVENKLITDKRALSVYHQTAPTGSAHIISHGSSITFALKQAEENESLHVSVIRGPGDSCKDYYINLPSWIDFEFSQEGKVALAHSGGRVILRIPPGPPVWQLRIIRSAGDHEAPAGDSIIISDDL
jgi:hypothetical protein